MRTEDVLAASGTGLWVWDDVRGVAVLDATAAALLGLAAEPATLSQAAVRSRIPIHDWMEMERAITLERSEGRIAEAEFRVVDERGELLRTLRLRVNHVAGEGLAGTLVEVLLDGDGERAHHAPGGEADWEWERAREAFVLDAGQALSEAGTTQEVLRVTAALAMPGFSPDGIAIYSREGDRIWLAEYHGTPIDTTDLGFPMSITAPYPAAEVLRTGRAVYLSTPEEYAERYPRYWPVIERYHRASWAYLPLVVAGRIIGSWLVAFTYHVDFTVENRAMLSTLARLLAQALSRTFLQDTERELAADLQHTMRPAARPVVPGMQVAARYVPTGGGLRVGGDWYDVIPLPSGRVALVIGDVQGHDVRAAAVMAQLRIALRAYASEGHRPDAVLSRASRFLSALTSGDAGQDDPRFATCLYLEVDPPTGTLDVARAGHLDPGMVLPDGTLLTRPTAGGLPLGVGGVDAVGDDYPTTRLNLQPGEILLLCTDGLVETGHGDLEVGWARLGSTLRGLSGLHLDDLADTVIESVQAPAVRVPPSSVAATAPLVEGDRDDIALVLLRRPPGAGGRPPEQATRVRRVVLSVGQSEPAKIAQARREISAMLHEWDDAERVFGAVLMLSELLGNVLRHTDGDALLVAELSGPPGDRLLRVEVSDPSDQLPHLREPGELASSGRGLLLMDSLCDAWGSAPRGMGKTTWFELHERQRTAR
ncbi:ATP-binding SpoIIE family protein phosphatase [Streptomyces millisiae]|uniref:SpoIIE family protein phosphatase n=1 Tax=Streptomyces millisiae TaxID=3075542 RepID=A0ABU2LTC2_9ACTN|nr:SpoIIE family protein phosphatase [Streptomyces sp. DSM 44918]MDT0320843.1 SpoIIE family protein phosphatase [Streptomyces sp. DSM 44918]